MHASHITVALNIGSRLAVFLSIAHGGDRDGAGLHNDRLATIAICQDFASRTGWHMAAMIDILKSVSITYAGNEGIG
jgi:hypothetical protein